MCSSRQRRVKGGSGSHRQVQKSTPGDTAPNSTSAYHTTYSTTMNRIIPSLVLLLALYVAVVTASECRRVGKHPFTFLFHSYITFANPRDYSNCYVMQCKWGGLIWCAVPEMLIAIGKHFFKLEMSFGFSYRC